jgi:hypothetical protein
MNETKKTNRGTCLESDSMGVIEVPADRRYSVQTAFAGWPLARVADSADCGCRKMRLRSLRTSAMTRPHNWLLRRWKKTVRSATPIAKSGFLSDEEFNRLMRPKTMTYPSPMDISVVLREI